MRCAVASKSALILAGGTGGHIFPGLAVAEALRSRGWSVSWLGTVAGLEAQLVPKAKIELHTMDVKGIRGKGLAGYLYAPLNILRAVWQATRLVKKIKPTLVIGFGGFVAGPGGVAAKLLGLPLIIHEQNAVAGTTNRLLAKIATHVCTAFPKVLRGAQVIGNPVRPVISALADPAARFAKRDTVYRVLVLGGSRGAKAINELLPEALAQLDPALRYQVRHQCGKGHAEATVALYKRYGIHVELSEFIDDMAAAYSWADMVVCRAGALTVSELAAAGLPALLVPFPYAIDDHQTVNAMFLVNAHAAVVIQQQELTAQRLADELTTTFFKREHLLVMAQNARACAATQTLDQLSALCEATVHGQ